MTVAAVAQILANRYRLREALGSGGMGQVFLAEDGWRGDRTVALKRVAATDGPACKSLEREFAWLCSLRHPHVVAVQDFGHCASTSSTYYTMERAPGRPLDELHVCVSVQLL